MVDLLQQLYKAISKLTAQHSTAQHSTAQVSDVMQLSGILPPKNPQSNFCLTVVHPLQTLAQIHDTTHIHTKGSMKFLDPMTILAQTDIEDLLCAGLLAEGRCAVSHDSAQLQHPAP